MRLHLLIVAIAPLTLLASCGESKTAPSQDGAANPDTPEPPQTEVVAKAVAGGAEKVEEKTDAYDFTYGWPAAAGDIPALRERLVAERDETRASFVKEAEDWQVEAKENGFNAPGYSYMKEWKVVTDLPRFLSLSADVYEFTGGAHGMSTTDALIWDREAQAGFKPVTMFISEGSLDRAVQDRFCDALDRLRAKKRGAPVKRSDDPFNDCIAPVANSTVILGSASKQAFDRIGFIVPPYNAGPYAEGEYEVTLPVDASIIDAVKPEYQKFFTPGS